jgi:hypothetical protein
MITPSDASPERSRASSLTRALEAKFVDCRLVRTFRRAAYDPGDVLEYQITGVVPRVTARMTVEVERFVGGGFAGQVYRVRLLSIESMDSSADAADEGVSPESSGGPAVGFGTEVAGLEIGQVYAIKILTPASGFSRLFRNTLYFLGYQAAFGAQVLPSAVRVGVLWQKLIRRAMALETGDADAVCDTFATFYDGELKSYGEINEWIEGRIWKFEADDRVFDRWQFAREVPEDHRSPEYVYKKRFMYRLVGLLHRMGAGELARQYEWWTCKSTPNVLKRVAEEGSPSAGLTAVDFRAGLTLLPFLPMSPADLRLILKGLLRGRLVQFDRCDMDRFRRYIESTDGFDDLQPAIVELERQTAIYRTSQPDLTHHHIRLLLSRSLRTSVRKGTITAWKSLGRLDDHRAEELDRRTWVFRVLYAVSIIPVIGPRAVTLWGSAASRGHLRRCSTSLEYMGRAMRGSRIEILVRWLREGRTSGTKADQLIGRPVLFWIQRLIVGWLPPAWHRFFADWGWARSKIREKVEFTLGFLRRPEFREQFLLDEVRTGRAEGMLSQEETDRIEAQIKDPFIQKYLRSLAVHLCTVPVTQVVMLLVGAGVTFYCLSVRGLSWPESLGLGTAAAAAIQLLPISPGSIARGVFVLYLMIRERDIKNYYIAAPVSFLHVIGYLAFPLQMVTHNPALARFLAGRWTKNTVHVVPVFGESGALLEHGVFDLFFNLPLTASREFRERPAAWVFGTISTLILMGALVLGVYMRMSILEA